MRAFEVVRDLVKGLMNDKTNASITGNFQFSRNQPEALTRVRSHLAH